ncbi:MAG: hypothetical protein M1832_000215 [Thelocarpon impressellum]|nr:MAG: hypothetical protein M1832_000215 [Thelocarpon impressellum]
MIMSASYFEVVTPQYQGNPNHTGVWVNTDPNNGSGEMFRVIGNILTGMTYERKNQRNPQYSVTFVPGTYEIQGWIYQADLERLADISRSIEVPGAQLGLSGKRLDATKPVRRCTEWTREVVAALVEQGVLHT